MNPTRLQSDNFTGCLLGGAVGDALGADTEFMSLTNILNKYGTTGVTNYTEFADGIGIFTDDTQMTLFTAEGLLSVNTNATTNNYVTAVYEAYLRWLITQTHSYQGYMQIPSAETAGLMAHKELFRLRAPGLTCMGSLKSGVMGTIEQPINHSKGCGGVMRVAPAGLLFWKNATQAFTIAAKLAAITHSHPSGYLSAGALAAILAFLVHGHSLQEAINQTLPILQQWNNHAETTKAILDAIALYQTTKPDFIHLAKLGEGWVGEEALSIALYCSLHFETDVKNAIILAANHSGDTDSTAAITGNIVGLMNGINAIPTPWQQNLQLADLVVQYGQKLFNKAQ